MRKTNQVRSYRLARAMLSIGLVAGSATAALHCGNGRDHGQVELRQSALTLQTENATGWWRLFHQASTFSEPIAAILTASRGTELFSVAFQSGATYFLGAYRTRSNIEITSFGGGSAGTMVPDDASMAAASADGNNTIDLFWRNTDRTIGTLQWTGTSFVTPTNAPQYGQALTGIGASGKTNRVDIFAIGTDHSVQQNWRGTGAWAGWNSIGSPSDGGAPMGGAASLQPAVLWLPTAPNNWLEVFAVAKGDGSVWMRRNQNNPQNPSWDSWKSLGGNVLSGIAATSAVTSSGAFRVDIFAVDTNGDIQRNTSSDGGSTWDGWLWIGRPPAGLMTTTIDGLTRYIAPTAISRGEGAIDLFVRDATGDIQLMTIRPLSALSGGHERTFANSPSCIDLAAQVNGSNYGENTAAITPCGVFLSYGNWGTLRMDEGPCFLNGPPPTGCGLPSGGPAPACAPVLDIRLPPQPGTSSRYGTGGPGGVDIISGFSIPNGNNTHSYGFDNQLARLNYNNSDDLIMLHSYGFCSPMPCRNPDGSGSTICPGGTYTTGPAIYKSAGASCGSSWSYQGRIDVCKLPDAALNNCYDLPPPANPTYCDNGGQADRPEMTARDSDLFVVHLVHWSAPSGNYPHLVWKSRDEGQTWVEWWDPSHRMVAVPPVELTTVGTHLALLSRQTDPTPTLWTMSKDNNSTTLPKRITDLPFSDQSWLNYGSDEINILQSAVSIAQAGHSADADYVRVVYPTLVNGAQAARTGLVRVNSDETVTVLTDSFGTAPQITAQSSGGSVVFATLIEADRVSGPPNADERPPVVLYWVETTKTPPSTDHDCVHGPFVAGTCDWGTASIKATVFRGGSQSPIYTISTYSSSAWRGNGDYVHGAARYVSTNAADRFFLHWYNENSAQNRMPMGRLLDVYR